VTVPSDPAGPLPGASPGQPPRPDLPYRPDLPPEPTARPPGRWGPPAATWGFWEAVLVGIVGFVAGGIVGALVANPTGREDLTNLQFVAIGLISEAGLFAAVAGWLAIRHRRASRVSWLEPPRPVDMLRFDPRKPVDAAIGFGCGLALYVVAVVGVGVLVQTILDLLTNRSIKAPDQLPDHLTGLALVLTGVLVLVAAPVAEELFFRGFLFRALRERHGFWFSGLISAALFGAVHFQPAPWQDWVLLVTVLGFVGLGLAAIYEWRRNLIANMAAHCAFNVIGFLFVAFKR
jgi:uncharacterized protein